MELEREKISNKIEKNENKLNRLLGIFSDLRNKIKEYDKVLDKYQENKKKVMKINLKNFLMLKNWLLKN